MSGAKKHGKTGLGHAMDAFSLGMVFLIGYGATRIIPSFGGGAAILGALGFLLLAGTLMSELVEVVGIPHLTGYLLAGIIAGPYVMHIIDHQSADRLEAVNSLAIALIALAGGAELRLSSLKDGLKGLVVATIIQTFVGLALSTAVFVFAKPAFVRDMPAMGILGVGLLWGVVSITRSPSAALGILSQTRASGPLARFTLSFVMASDVVVVVVLATVLTIARPMVEPGVALSFAAFGNLGHEILGSVAMGTTLGLLLAAYLKVIGKQLLVVLIALGFGATEVLHYLSLEPLLTFLVAGFVVQNLSKQGEKFLHAIEETGGIVYVIFFAGAGAHLNVPLLREFWPIAVLFTGTRALITFMNGKVASRIAKDGPAVRTWGWSPLISQAGVALGIASTIVRQFPSFGAGFRDIALACVAINELVGPVLFKFALDRTKETQAPSPSLSDAEEASPG
ncbi:transporter, monovalent cation:proton antiporter-2 (CPA2) family [Labilithrix luteola]|uniref:Transporter, monovalent cation:proton antiporter-2 (CPA2) family n=1 Tax=Labilithrix luteola TaxID=1391654 RepID=A0A0K1QBI1_9BACT|nr:cation:proton antiporter [Labilithrix luteola]AKV03146.1 transporter, monovalent cation:proton antiporter-2 (CPA2) family [Labilithrix luteola]